LCPAASRRGLQPAAGKVEACGILPSSSFDRAAVPADRLLHALGQDCARLQEINARLVPLLASLESPTVQPGWREWVSGSGLEHAVSARELRLQIAELTQAGAAIHLALGERARLLARSIDLGTPEGRRRRSQGLAHAAQVSGQFSEVQGLVAAMSRQRRRADRPFRSPLQASSASTHVPALVRLRRRTVVIGLVGTTCAVAAAAALVHFVGLLLAAQAQRGGLPALHLPLNITTSPVLMLLQGAAVLTAGHAALQTLRFGSFRRVRAWWAGAALLAALSVWQLQPTQRWLHVVPSALERHLLAGDPQRASALLDQAALPDTARHYLQAQVALVANDPAALRRHGVPLLVAANSPTDAITLDMAVVDAIDVALHGQPTTTATVQWEQHGGALRPTPRWLQPTLALAASALLALAARALIRLWQRMRRRVRELRTRLSMGD
jgi:hypothetical protein